MSEPDIKQVIACLRIIIDKVENLSEAKVWAQVAHDFATCDEQALAMGAEFAPDYEFDRMQAMKDVVASGGQDGLANFCPACQAIPTAGFCGFSGCPKAPPLSEYQNGYVDGYVEGRRDETGAPQ